MSGIVRPEDGPETIAPMEMLGYLFAATRNPGPDLLQKYRGMRVAHAHMFVIGTEDWRRHLLFRDYLRRHPDTARAYAQLKTDLAKRYRDDRPAYTDGKTAFTRWIVERPARKRVEEPG